MITSTKVFRSTTLMFLLIGLSCNKNEKGKTIVPANSEIKFSIDSPLSDSLSLNKKYFNSITFYPRLDSIRESEVLAESEIKSSTFLFVYQFGPDESTPNKIEEYDESKSDIFIPEKSQTISFDYSFDQKGMNNMVLIFLENIYFETKSGDSLRIIDNYGIYKHRVFIED